MTMDFHIGVDCVEIERFEGILDNERLLNRLFTSNEIAYCRSKAYPPAHFAVRFAAKEAVIKAFSGLGLKIHLHDIEVLKDKNKVPYVTIHDQDLSDHNVKISLSHSKTTAVAMAVASPTATRD